MLLDKKVLELNHGVSYGSVTLKSLQNNNIPDIDLLVREAIQNSSDASLGVPGDLFTVHFNTGFFAPSSFNTILSGIEDILNQKYPIESAEYLEIRDTKTTGLTGCVRLNDINTDDHGNFFKLIFDTGKKQTRENAGGNWGFGKSVYYRVGIGIVIFYSRIYDGSGYESRLIITLVEDENNPDAILSKISYRSAGKAWWGIKDGEDMLPLTDDELIKEILKIFKVRPFESDETGTSIIIPYIKTKELLRNIIPAEVNVSEDIRACCTWANNFEEYLNLAIQKWYAPKIHNRNLRNFCNKKWLQVYINDIPINYNSMLPFFKLVQELYTTAVAKTYNYEYHSKWLTEIMCLPVQIRNYFDTSRGDSTSGYVAAIRISKNDLYNGMNYLDPYIYTRHFEKDPDINEPMVMYARDPGMVIEYTISGPWVKNITPPEDSDEYIFAFYVPITFKRIKADLSEKKYADMELGEYLRNCESSDHMGWKDPTNMQIIERIQKNTVTQIRNHIISPKSTEIETTASKLSGTLGKKLLPRIGYGRTQRGSGGGGNGDGETKIDNVSFSVLSQSIVDSELNIDYELKLTQGKKSVEFTILIDSEGGLIDPRSWQNEIGTTFPVSFIYVDVKSLSSNVESELFFDNIFCNADMHYQSNNYVELILSDDRNEMYTFKIISHISSPVIKGTMRLKTADKKYRPSFKIV